VNFLFDESVDRPVAERLRNDGHDVACIWEMAPGISDDVVLDKASRSGALLVTCDKDFGELVFRQGRATGGVVLVRLAGLTNRAKAQVVADVVREHGDALPGAFTVVTPGMVRIRRMG